MAALVVGLALGGCGGGSHRAATPTTTSTSVAGTTTSSTAPAGPYVWSRAASPTLAVGGGASSTLTAVLAPAGAGQKWLLAGSRLAAAGTSTATVWTSPDAAVWTASALAGPQVNSAATAAARFESTTVIVGSVGSGDQQQASIWVSPTSGAAFVPVPAADLPGGAAAMTTVAGSGLGWFAAGRSGSQVALWYSSNGRRWTSLDAARGVIDDATNPHINALLATAGGVLAGGWEQDGSHTDAAVWATSDGVSWHPVLSAATAFAGGGDRVITSLGLEGNGIAGTGVGGSGTTPSRYVAVGAIRTGTSWRPASWISPDGASWSPPSTAFAMGARPQDSGLYPGWPGPDAGAVVRALSISSSGAIWAVGGSATAQRVWHSADGTHWSEIGLPGPAADSAGWLAGLVATSGGSIVVADGRPGQPHLLVDGPQGWSQPSASPAVFGAVQAVARPTAMEAASGKVVVAVAVLKAPQAIGPVTITTDILVSPDASLWQLAASGAPFAGATVRGLAPVGGRVVAVGYQAHLGRPRAVAWSSPDGRRWTGPAPLDQTAPAGGDMALGACRAGNSVVAAGAATEAVPVGSAPGSAPAPRSAPGRAPSTTRPKTPARRLVELRTVARTWTSTDGTHWHAASVGAGPHPETAAAILGCAPAPGGPAAYGTANPTGALQPAPAFWTDSVGRWLRAGTSPWGSGLPAPVEDLAVPPSNEAPAVGGGTVTTATSPPGTAGPGGPPVAWLAVGGAAPYPARTPPVLAQSTNSGSSWQVVATDGPAWQGSSPARLADVGWMGAIPLVAGSVDGRLAIWVGTPNFS